MTAKKKRTSPGNGEALNTDNQPTKGGNANGTEPGVLLLLSRLQGVREVPKDHPSWKAFCPCHDDVGTNPSLNVDYQPSKYVGEDWLPLVFCRTCWHDIVLRDVCEAVGLSEQRVRLYNEPLKSWGGFAKPKRIAPLPRPCDVERWQERLHADPDLIAYLYEQRGLSLRTIRRYRIGHNGRRYTLPVIGKSGRIVNVRLYKPDAEAIAKMLNLPGFGSPPRLYPRMPRKSWVLLCEGEWDALVALQHGLPAVTHTGGVRHWNDKWNERFAGKDVAIAYDRDEAGRNGSQGVAQALVGVANKVKVVDLERVGLFRKEDLTDWFVKYRYSAKYLRTLIKATAEWSS